MLLSDFVSAPLKIRAVEGLAYLLTYITFFRCLTQKKPSPQALLFCSPHCTLMTMTHRCSRAYGYVLSGGACRRCRTGAIDIIACLRMALRVVGEKYTQSPVANWALKCARVPWICDSHWVNSTWVMGRYTSAFNRLR